MYLEPIRTRRTKRLNYFSAGPGDALPLPGRNGGENGGYLIGAISARAGKELGVGTVRARLSARDRTMIAPLSSSTTYSRPPWGDADFKMASTSSRIVPLVTVAVMSVVRVTPVASIPSHCGLI